MPARRYRANDEGGRPVLAQRLADNLQTGTTFELGAKFDGAILTVRGGRKQRYR